MVNAVERRLFETVREKILLLSWPNLLRVTGGIRKHNLPCIPSVFPCCLHHLYVKAWENPGKTEIIRGSPISSVVHQTVFQGGSCPTKLLLLQNLLAGSSLTHLPPLFLWDCFLHWRKSHFTSLLNHPGWQHPGSCCWTFTWDPLGNGPAQPGGQEWLLWTPQCDHHGNPALDVSLHFMCGVYLAKA